MVSVIHVEMIDVQGDVLLLLARLMPVEAILETTSGQQEDQKYTEGTCAHRDVEQRHPETIRAISLFLVETRGTVTHTVAPQDRADACLDFWTPDDRRKELELSDFILIKF